MDVDDLIPCTILTPVKMGSKPNLSNPIWGYKIKETVRLLFGVEVHLF